MILQATGVGKSFSGNRVLHGVDFELRAGEVHVLAGENGAGKSTLVKVFAGVHRPDEGALALGGTKVKFHRPGDAARAGVAAIHQELSLVNELSVVENIVLGRETHLGRKVWLDWKGEERLAREACSKIELALTADELAQPVGELPLAMKYRIEIAKALAAEARVFIMDEPTSALNHEETERLFALIARLKEARCGIIYISHRIEEIFRIADRITVLRDGRHVVTVERSACTEHRLVEWMVGRPVDRFFPVHERRVPTAEVPRLKVDRLSISRPRRTTDDQVQPFSFCVAHGETVGLFGLHGSGCGEVLNALFGGIPLREGRIEIDGTHFVPGSPAHAVRSGIGYVTGDRKASGLVAPMSIRANITLASLPALSPRGLLDLAVERRISNTRIESLAIRAHSGEQEVGTLSGGNQQKVVLAKWLETAPRVLLMDEPTRGIDVAAKHEIYALLRRLAGDGIAMVITSTDIAEMLSLCDRILVLHRGRLVAAYESADVTAARLLGAAMGGTA